MPLPRLQSKREALWKEVSCPLIKEAVEHVEISQDQVEFYSHNFLAIKRTGGFQPIRHLSGLNMYLRASMCHMETLISILQGDHKGWWMVSLDLKHTYQHMPTHPSHWWYLRLAWQGAHCLLMEGSFFA